MEQKGEARLLLFSYPIEVRLAITEFAADEGGVARGRRQFPGDVRRLYLDGRARAGCIRLRYSRRMVPDFFVPPLIGTWVLRHNVETTFGALVDEIVRRQSAAAPRSQGAAVRERNPANRVETAEPTSTA